MEISLLDIHTSLTYLGLALCAMTLPRSFPATMHYIMTGSLSFSQAVEFM